MQRFCYDDDKLLVEGGTRWERNRKRAQAGVNAVTERTFERILEVAGLKTRAVWFFQPIRKRKPAQLSLLVNGETVQIQANL